MYVNNCTIVFKIYCFYNKGCKGSEYMKKFIALLFILGLIIYGTWDNEEKIKQKEHNVNQIEKNIEPYQIKE